MRGLHSACRAVEMGCVWHGLRTVDGPLQEAWIENLTEVLALAAHTRGRVVQPAAVEDFILFITICLSSPQYMKNPYLRQGFVVGGYFLSMRNSSI